MNTGSVNKYHLIKKIFFWSAGVVVFLLLSSAVLVYVFKDKIIGVAVGEINKYLNAKVDIDPKIDLSLFEKFPEVSIKFKNVKIYEGIKGSTNLLGSSKSVFATFNAYNIINGKYTINNLYVEDGEFNLKVDKEGNINYNILKEDTTVSVRKGQGSGFDLQKIKLTNIRVTYLNEKINQRYDILNRNLLASLSVGHGKYTIGLEGNQLIHTVSISGNEYFKEKEIRTDSKLEYNNNEKTFNINSASISVEKTILNVTGYYSFKNENRIDIQVKNDKSNFATLLSLLPKKYYSKFSQYESEGDVFFNGTVKGLSNEHVSPAINVEFGCKDASFFHPGLKTKIKGVNMSGKFSNGEARNASTSFLKLENIRLEFDDKLIQGNFLYRNFNDPYIAFDLIGKAEVAALLEFYPVAAIKSASGLIEMNIDFKGRLNDLKSRAGQERVDASGEINILNINFSPANSKYAFKNLSGNFLFNKNDVAVSDLIGKAGESDFRLNGFFKNIFSKLFLEKEILFADLELQSEHINLDELLSYELSKTSEKNSIDAETGKKGNYPYLEDYLIRIKSEVKHVHYKKISVTKFSGEFTFDQPIMKLNNVSFHLCGGKVNLHSLCNLKADKSIDNSVKATLSQIQIDSLLYVFDNFGQKFLTDKNLKGEYNGSIEAAFSTDANFKIKPKSVVATIDVSVIKGELIDFEPMQKLSKFIDAQELAHVRFSELKNKIFIENEKISIPEMQIISNVSDISVSGTHSFNNEMDYKLAVPLKNLKKPKVDKDAAFGAIEEDKKGGGSTLFLTITGTPENLKIAYDTKRTKNKIKEDLKKEKQEFLNIFKKKEKEIQSVKPNQQEFFDF